MKVIVTTVRILLAVIFMGIAGWNFLLYLSAVQKNETRSMDEIRRQATVNPWNPAPWSTLGRVYAVNLSQASMEEASRCFLRAARYNPWYYRYWAECAQALSALNQPQQALRCMRMATEFNRSYADFYWEAANFFIRHGRAEEAAPCFRRTLEGNPALIQPVLHLCWRIYPDKEFILRKILPETAPMTWAALRWSVNADNPDMAAVCFRTLMKIRVGVQLMDLNGYFTLLLSHNLLKEAQEAWLMAVGTLLKVSLYAPGNLVCNGNFELPLFCAGFDWITSPGPHTWIGVDAQTRYRDFHALGIFFDGAENATGPFLSQYIRVKEGGRFRFQYAIKAEGLDSNQGPFFEILWREADGSRRPLLTCPQTQEDTDWKLDSVTFDAPPEGGLLQLVLRRNASARIDSTMKGRIWLDDVEVVREKEEP